MTTTGSSGSICCDRRSSSIPSMPSIFRSVTRMPEKSALRVLSADVALSWTSISNPARPSHCVTACRIEASSSTNRIGPVSGMDGNLDRRAPAPMARQLDGHFSAAPRQVPGVNLAAKILHDAIRDRQPQAKPLAQRLGGEERIKDLVDLAGWNAGPVVRNLDQDVALRDLALRRLRRDGDPAMLLVGDRVERVAHQIENDLLELNRMAEHPKISLDRLVHDDTSRLDLAFEQEQRAIDRPIDLHGLRMAWLALARKCLEVAGDPCHALGKVRDEIEVAYDLREVTAAREDLRARHEGADRRERLVDLMRQRRRHLPERRQLAGLHQLILGGAQPRFGVAMSIDLGLPR